MRPPPGRICWIRHLPTSGRPSGSRADAPHRNSMVRQWSFELPSNSGEDCNCLVPLKQSSLAASLRMAFRRLHSARRRRHRRRRALAQARHARLPAPDRRPIQLSGLSAEVTVRRDEHGVPHIQAANLDDLFAAQGYVTAQDRLWQMDMTRRYVAGEIAEVLGKSLVPHDRVQRLLEMRPKAEHIVAGLSDRDRRFLEDYARGVNAFIAAHQDTLPAEFRPAHVQAQTLAARRLGAHPARHGADGGRALGHQARTRTGPRQARPHARREPLPCRFLARPPTHRRRPRPHHTPAENPRRPPRRIPNQTRRTYSSSAKFSATTPATAAPSAPTNGPSPAPTPPPENPSCPTTCTSPTRSPTSGTKSISSAGQTSTSPESPTPARPSSPPVITTTSPGDSPRSTATPRTSTSRRSTTTTNTNPRTAGSPSSSPRDHPRPRRQRHRRRRRPDRSRPHHHPRHRTRTARAHAPVVGL